MSPEHVAAGAQAALSRAAALVRPAIDDAVARLQPQLREPVAHHLAGGGKGVRAGLVVIAAAASGGTELDGVVGAVAVELIHNYSLIHDDIIDNDEERRHRPTVWAAFGTGRAIVVGDALANLAVQLLLEDHSPARVRAAQVLTEATALMISGQADDMAFERRQDVSAEECLRMEEGKTGALLSCASAIGAVLGGGDDATIKALSSFGLRLGMAFQAVDDVLGIWGEPARTGKPVGSDLLAHKQSLPVVIARASGGPELAALLASDLDEAGVGEATRLMEEAGARREVMAIADRALAEALESLQSVPLVTGYRDELAAIARFVTERDR
ncbi:MAG: polyprenyl synthetase family protein [Acidimicrobiales bacterium]